MYVNLRFQTAAKIPELINSVKQRLDRIQGRGLIRRSKIFPGLTFAGSLDSIPAWGKIHVGQLIRCTGWISEAFAAAN